MTPLRFRPALIGMVFYVHHAAGLGVAPGSRCEAVCAIRDGDARSDGSVSKSDIVCQDEEYSTTEEGRRFKACIECLKDSEHVNGTDSDISSMLYNFRFALDTCLYDDDRTETKSASEITGCLADDACFPLEDALTFDDLKPDGEDMYGYCTADDKAFVGRQMQSCLTCLHSSDDHVFLSNFMVVLTGGCAYKPKAGDPLRFTGDVFSDDEILIQSPKSEQGGDKESDEPALESSSGGLSREFIIGIVVGICGLFGLAIILFFIYYMRFRQREPSYPDTDDDADTGNLAPMRRSLRHHASIDPDPVPFNNPPRLYNSFGGSSDGGSSAECGETDYFDYVNATKMMQKPEADSGMLPAHAAYRPYIRSKNQYLGVEADGGSVRAPSSVSRF